MVGCLIRKLPSITFANELSKMSANLREMMLATYGPLMDAKDMCKVLRYPSVAALLAAKGRGRVTFKLAELEGRRGYFGLTEQIAAYMESAFNGGDPATSKGNQSTFELSSQ
jgi:hypothetical protein